MRIQDGDGFLELNIPFAEKAAREAIRRFKPLFDKTRKVWKVQQDRSGAGPEEVVAAVEAALRSAASEPWLKALPKLSAVAATTRRFGFVAGLGGLRLRLAPGHKHEYTFKAMKNDGVVREGAEWIIPSHLCLDKRLLAVVADVLRDDRAALGKMLDYMAPFTIGGGLNLIEDEAARAGLAKGAVVFGNPAFLKKADPSTPLENLNEYPFRVLSCLPREDGAEVVFGFVTGNEAWDVLSRRYGRPSSERSMQLDVGHVTAKWVRRKIV